MVQYFWNPGMRAVPQGQQMVPQQMIPQQMVPPPVTLPTSNRGRGEQSYIENILRLNRGLVGTFHFAFEHATTRGGTNVVVIRGFVEAAGRDHVIIRESATDKRYLMPMIYFNFAEFDEEMKYFDQSTQA